MGDMYRMKERVCDEIDKIAEKGLSSGNLDTAYKLVDMYKDISTVEAMEDAGYSQAYEDYPASMAMSRRSYEDAGNSYRGRKRDSMGRYSRNNGYDGYSQAKQNYRYSRDGSNKQAVLDGLEDKMRSFEEELKQMSKDADFPEERQMIDKYVGMMERANR